MRNLKFLLCIIVLVFTVSCTDNTENLVTNTETTDVKSIGISNGDSLDIPINTINFTGDDEGNGNGSGKGN